MYIGRSQQEEEKYLQTTIKAINELIEEFDGLSTEQDKEIRKQRKFLWDNRNEFDEFEVLENCSQIALEEKTYANKLNKLKSLERQLKSPYFARLDFKEKGEEGDSFYIGLASVEDKDNFDFYVFDWRSPVANMFYDFEVGPAFYNAPIGKIEGDIEFSRQFNIKNSKIVFTHDSGAALCDESLTAMLDRNATDKMKNIVATIQKEQNDIIRNDDAKTLFIQGAAGSGKTSIALHRAAYLLYKHRKNLQADNILIFSPNEVFAEYISDVLPELGENNVLQTTFDAYAKKSLPADYYFENKAEHLDYLYSGDQELANRVLAMEYKNSMKFMEIIESFCRDLPEKLVKCKPIFIDGKQIIPVKSVANTFLKRFNDIPLLNRLDVVKQSIFSQVENRFLNSDSGDYDFEYVEDKESLVGTEMAVKLIDFSKENLSKIVASRKILLEEAKAKKEAITWDSLQVGDIVKAEIKRFTNFGAFAEVDGVDGLIHLSQISWSHIKSCEEVLKIGQIVDVKIINLDKETKKLSLSIKELTPEPWSVVDEKYSEGSAVLGKVVRINDFGAFVELEPGIDGLVHISKISHDHIKHPSEVLSIGQEVKCIILSIDKENRKIALSIKDAE